MILKRGKKNLKKGSILVLVMILMIVATQVSLSTIYFSKTETDRLFLDEERLVAKYAAIGVLEKAKAEIVKAPYTTLGNQWLIDHADKPPVKEVVNGMNVELWVTTDGNDWYSLTAKAYRSTGDLLLSISLDVQARDSFARYIFFTNTDTIRFGPGTIYGDIHTNKDIEVLYGNVDFKGKVTASGEVKGLYGAVLNGKGANVSFAKGFVAGAKELSWPQKQKVDTLRREADSDYSFTSDSSKWGSFFKKSKDPKKAYKYKVYMKMKSNQKVEIRILKETYQQKPKYEKVLEEIAYYLVSKLTKTKKYKKEKVWQYKWKKENGTTYKWKKTTTTYKWKKTTTTYKWKKTTTTYKWKKTTTTYKWQRSYKKYYWRKPIGPGYAWLNQVSLPAKGLQLINSLSRVALGSPLLAATSYTYTTTTTSASPGPGWELYKTETITETKTQPTSPGAGWVKIQTIYQDSYKTQPTSPGSGWTKVQTITKDIYKTQATSPGSGWTKVQTITKDIYKTQPTSPGSGWAKVQTIHLYSYVTTKTSTPPGSEWSLQSKYYKNEKVWTGEYEIKYGKAKWQKTPPQPGDKVLKTWKYKHWIWKMTGYEMKLKKKEWLKVGQDKKGKYKKKVATLDYPYNNLMFSDYPVVLQDSRINGKITLAVNNSVEIEGSLKYVDDDGDSAYHLVDNDGDPIKNYDKINKPWTKENGYNYVQNEDYDGNSKLGIMSVGDVTVTKNAPYNVEIQAAIFSESGKFTCSTDKKKGNFRYLGSITQWKQGVRAKSYGSSWKGWGASGAYIYDNSFLTDPPAYWLKVNKPRFDSFKYDFGAFIMN